MYIYRTQNCISNNFWENWCETQKIGVEKHIQCLNKTCSYFNYEKMYISKINRKQLQVIKLQPLINQNVVETHYNLNTI